MCCCITGSVPQTEDQDIWVEVDTVMLYDRGVMGELEVGSVLEGALKASNTAVREAASLAVEAIRLQFSGRIDFLTPK